MESTMSESSSRSVDLNATPDASTVMSSSSTHPVPSLNSSVTEDEAALYDRQIRLWGLEAQNRLRTAHILVVGWDGVATEIVKNTVLSGVGHVTIMDSNLVDDSVDLASGFFFREKDVKQPKCSKQPLDRIRALNPLVKVDGIVDRGIHHAFLRGSEEAYSTLSTLAPDVMVVTSSGNRDTLTCLNGLARSLNIKFFTCYTYGLGGFYFADQLVHDYIVERPIPGSSTGEKKRLKQRQEFIPLSESLAHRWTSLTERQKKRVRVPLDFFTVLAMWDLAPSSDELEVLSLKDLESKTRAIIEEKGLLAETIIPSDMDTSQYFETFLTSVKAKSAVLSPIASILGGILSQDILNSVGGREEPVVNWLFLEVSGNGAASVHKIGDIQGGSVVN